MTEEANFTTQEKRLEYLESLFLPVNLAKAREAHTINGLQLIVSKEAVSGTGSYIVPLHPGDRLAVRFAKDREDAPRYVEASTRIFCLQEIDPEVKRFFPAVSGFVLVDPGDVQKADQAAVGFSHITAAVHPYKEKPEGRAIDGTPLIPGVMIEFLRPESGWATGPLEPSSVDFEYFLADIRSGEEDLEALGERREELKVHLINSVRLAVLKARAQRSLDKWGCCLPDTKGSFAVKKEEGWVTELKVLDLDNLKKVSDDKERRRFIGREINFLPGDRPFPRLLAKVVAASPDHDLWTDSLVQATFSIDYLSRLLALTDEDQNRLGKTIDLESFIVLGEKTAEQMMAGEIGDAGSMMAAQEWIVKTRALNEKVW